VSLRVGDDAPDFELQGIDPDGEAGRYRLSDQRGSTVVLAFYPADRSRVCTRQLNSYTENVEDLDRAGLTLWAISPQSVESHRDFAASERGFAVPLLSDEGRTVGRAYGILGLLDMYRRSTVIVDPTGKIVHMRRAFGPGFSFPTVAELVAAAR
jgi:peroxiredoxin Q/BCP